MSEVLLIKCQMNYVAEQEIHATYQGKPLYLCLRMGLGALCLLERFNKSEPLYMLCMFTSAVCSFVYPFTTKPLGKENQMRECSN